VAFDDEQEASRQVSQTDILDAAIEALIMSVQTQRPVTNAG
jgi:hypothetical protein